VKKIKQNEERRCESKNKSSEEMECERIKGEIRMFK
jgi:hypothetical protein